MLKGIFAAALVFATTYRAAATSTEVPLTIGADGIVTVSASINGAGPFTLMLDTGANRSAVSTRLARTLGLKPAGRTAIVTATAAAPREIVRLTRLMLGEVAKQDLLVPVLDSRDMSSIGAGVDGILGQDFLLDQNYTLDYEHRRLSWTTDVPGRRAMATLALTESEGRWLVSLPQGNDHGIAARFVPDSGAGGLIVFDRGCALPLSVAPLARAGQITTLNGSTTTRAVLVQAMSIGSIVWKNTPALVVDRRDPDAPAGDGLLPLSTFASVSFSASKASLTVRAR